MTDKEKMKIQEQEEVWTEDLLIDDILKQLIYITANLYDILDTIMKVNKDMLDLCKTFINP